jgi:hypothetical protein
MLQKSKVNDVINSAEYLSSTPLECTALEFLARLTPHIPNKWEQTVRYFGYYSHRTRGKRRKEAAQKLASLEFDAELASNSEQQGSSASTSETPAKHTPSSVTENKRAVNTTWQALIKRIFEVDPLVCASCGGQMKIKAFVTDTSEVARLLKHLKIPGFEKPPPIQANSPPGTFVPDPEYLQYMQSLEYL